MGRRNEGMKSITLYETEDGKFFDNENDAITHEYICKGEQKIEKYKVKNFCDKESYTISFYDVNEKLFDVYDIYYCCSETKYLDFIDCVHNLYGLGSDEDFSKSRRIKIINDICWSSNVADKFKYFVITVSNETLFEAEEKYTVIRIKRLIDIVDILNYDIKRLEDLIHERPNSYPEYYNILSNIFPGPYINNINGKFDEITSLDDKKFIDLNLDDKRLFIDYLCRCTNAVDQIAFHINKLEKYYSIVKNVSCEDCDTNKGFCINCPVNRVDSFIGIIKRILNGKTGIYE